MSQVQNKKDLFHVALSKQIAEQITRGTASFLTAHENERIDLPYNPVTGKNYTAANNMILSAKGYSDSRWLTYDQAAEQGYQVKKGEKATEIAYYHYVDYNTKEKLDKPKIQTVKLFNAEQLTGIEKMTSRTSSKEEALAKVQSIFENSQVKIVNNQKDKVFYRTKDDTIYMPPKEAYKDELAYSSAALHELCRWAGNGEDRLNYETVPFGTEAFARQKLRAEIATYMLCKEMGIPFEPQGQQFSDQWAQIIEKHPFEILNAAKDAEKIKGFVMEFDKTLEKAQELEQNQEVQTKKISFEPRDYTDYYKVYEHGHSRTTSFNLYVISQLYAMCEEKHMELVEIQKFRSQIEDTIDMNKEDEDIVKYETEILQEVEAAIKDNSTYVIYNPEFSERFTFISGNTLEELIESISHEPHILDLRSIDFEPRSKKDVYLTVPKEHEEQVKSLGAEFDEEENRWYIPRDTDLTPFENWMYEEVEEQQPLLLENTNIHDFETLTQYCSEHNFLFKNIDGFISDIAADIYIYNIRKDYDDPNLPVWQEELKQAEAERKNGAKYIIGNSNKTFYLTGETFAEVSASISNNPELVSFLQNQQQAPQLEQTQQAEQAPKKEWKEMIKLSVPYDDKDEAKKLGAKWSGKQQTWYVLDGADLQLFYNWLPKEKKVELIMASRDYLNVPREEKDEAKALGAKWDRFQKSWYVEKGTDLEPFAKWTGQTPKEEQAVSQTAEQSKQEQTAEQTQEHTEKQEVTVAPKLAEDKTFLAVPFDEKNAAKKLGAKWDKDNKSWFVEKGADLNQFKDWLVDENTIIPAKQEAVSPEIEFAEHCRANGLDVDAPIMDGQIHRVPLIGKPQGKDGAYCGYLDGVPSGWSQNYVTGEKNKFISSGMQLTEEEKAKQRAEHAQKLQEREAKRQIGYDNAAKRAEKIYKEAKEVTLQNIHGEDSYLGKKGVLPHVAKQNDYGQLVIPLHNIEGEIRGVQFINQDGSKHFLTGIEKKGNFTLLSDDVKNATKVLVCEGFATGASLHEATKLPVAVAFDAGNIESVSKALAEKYKGIEITICADNDQYRDNNVGLEKAKKAALAVGAKLAVPQFSKEEQAQKLTDFNDLHKAEGLEAVSRQVSQAKKLTQNIAQNKTQSKKKTAQLAR